MPTGIYPRTDGCRQILSEAQKKLYRNGYVNPNKNKPLSEKTKILISKKKKEYYQNHPGEAERHAKILQEHNLKHPRKGKKSPMYGRRKEKSPNWRGGRTIWNKHVCIFKPDHPYATQTGYVQESRLVMEKVLGWYLTSEEVVHHKNGNPLDNRPENLEVLSQSEHAKKHGIGENNPNWNGGRYKQAGVVFVRAPENHPYARKGYIQEHRLIMEQHLGRHLKPFPEEHIIHINGVKDDNCIENLELISK